MSFLETLKASRERDHLAELFTAEFSGTHSWQPVRKGKFGPVPQFTEGIAASVSPEQAHQLDVVARQLGVSKSALIREAVSDFLLKVQEAAS